MPLDKVKALVDIIAYRKNVITFAWGECYNSFVNFMFCEGLYLR